MVNVKFLFLYTNFESYTKLGFWTRKKKEIILSPQERHLFIYLFGVL